MNAAPLSASHTPWVGAWWAACMGAWLIGVALQLQRSQLGSLTQDGAIALCVLGLAAVVAVWPRPWPTVPRRVLCCLAWGLAGWTVANAHAHWRLSQALPSALEARDIQLTGVVATLPQLGPLGLRFVLEVDEGSLAGLQRAARDEAPTLQRSAPQRLALSWSNGSQWPGARAAPAVPNVRAGERWQFTVRLRQPHGLFNPHGFDRELTLFEQGVRATGTVREGQRLQSDAGYRLQGWRQRVRDGIEAAVPDVHTAGVLTALAVGDQGAIETDDWGLFRVTGVSHLMSISGLHVTMFAWLAARCLGWLWRRSPRAMQWCAAPSVARWGGLLAALAYAAFSGWGVPAQRTVWMLAVVTLVGSGGRRWPWPWVLLAAAVVVTALDPWALLQPGFWLSFMAVALLMMSSEPAGSSALNEAPPAAGQGVVPAVRGAARSVAQAVADGARTQWIATWGLAPLSLVFFKQVSMVGLVANLVAIPCVTLLITPLALLGVVWSEFWLWGAWCVQQLKHFLALLATWPVAVWTVPAAPWWAQCSGLLAGALWMMRLPWAMRALSVPLVLPLLWPATSAPAWGEFEVLAVDVGQGTAVGVQTAHHWLLFDAGPRYTSDSDAGQRVLLPLMQSLGHRRIDRLMISHRDSDHIGGAATLLQGLPVGSFWSSVEPLHPVHQVAQVLGVPVQRCEAGQSWQWDGVRFDVLHPLPQDYALPLRPNAMSCVLRVGTSRASVLLTGDIEKSQEAALVARQGAALASTVLIVPHHGSRTSSTPDFLARVQPEVAVVQAGYRNRFGHPVATVMQRYERRGVVVHTTPQCGAWRWRSTEPARQARCERDAGRRYWHWRPEAEIIDEAALERVERQGGPDEHPHAPPH